MVKSQTMSRHPWLFLLLLAGCSEAADTRTDALACVDQAVEGPLPLTIDTIDTRMQGDDISPSVTVGTQGAYEELVYAWTPASDGEVAITLTLEADMPPPETHLARKIYRLNSCDASPSTGGVAGASLHIDTVADQTVLFAVEGCEADCRVVIDHFVEGNDSGQ